MLEQILNNDENTNEDGTKSQASTSGSNGREPSHDDQLNGYFVQNGSTFNG